jgi:hypothetical protein
MYYKVKLPTFKLEQVKDRYERATSAVKAAQKTASLKAKAKASITNDSNDTNTSSNTLPKENTTLKSLIKDKLKKSVQRKEDTQALEQLHISFPKDKPTFDSTLLTKDEIKAPGVSEERLYNKAQAIKEKLAEFNIDVEIE